MGDLLSPSQSSLRDASSPKGGATGVSVRLALDERGFFLSEAIVPCCLGEALVQMPLPA